jgi:glycerol-3-phosphate cytidylyltransferase
LFIDDKNLNVDDWKPTLYKKGIIAGAFDLLHPGYIQTFEYAKQHCDFLVAALHEDPSVERQEKAKPLLSVDERKQALLSLQNVDEVVVYKTENELRSLLQSGDYSVRFLGDDYIGKNFTGSDLEIKEIVYVPRKHGWSYRTLLEKIRKGG